MGKLTGPLQISGSFGGMTIDKNGNVRAKQAGRKINAVRTLENNSEFGAAGAAGKLIREALRSQLQTAKDSQVVGRLTKALRAALNYDTTGARGMRQVLAANCGLLLGFNFNLASVLSQSFYAPYSISASGAGVTLSIPSLDPRIDVAPPQGATHYEVVYMVASIDLVTKAYKVASLGTSLGIQLLTAAAQTNISQVATLPVAPTADELVIAVMGMNFYQRINGQNYPLNNNASNPLSIVYTSASGVAPAPVTPFTTAITGPSQTLANTTITSAGAEKLEFDELTTGTSVAYNMVISVGGAQVASIDTFDRYNGRPFRFTEANGTAHTGVFTASGVNF